MDAVKFIEEHRRMYKVAGKHLPTLAEGIPAEDVVKEVEEWSAAHPRKTRQDVFLEQWPETYIRGDGYLMAWSLFFPASEQLAGELWDYCKAETFPNFAWRFFIERQKRF